MLSKMVTGGTTLVINHPGKYFGMHLLQVPSGVVLQAYDAAATASIAEANQIDQMAGNVAAGTLLPPVQGFAPNPKGVSLKNGLSTWMTAAGTAFVYYE